MKALLIVISFFACVKANSQIMNHNGWKTYHDKEFYFSLSYPPDWEFDQNISNAKCIIYTSKYKAAKYRANIAVDTFQLPVGAGGQQTTVRAFAETSFGQLRKNMQDCNVMVTKDVSQNGIPQFLVIASGTINGKYLYVKQLYCLYQQIAYIINYTGEAGIKDPFAIAVGDIINSFKPLKTATQ